ncbi:MAG: hypothetical protein LUH14_06145 [Clostridiaceae bacterium]|nr:hypothetical protein [Clostridiaceae bacterium]
MAHVIEMPGGEYITPFCFQDALDAVEEYAGVGLREFIEEYMQDNVDEAGEARLEAEETRKDMEMDADHFREVLCAVEEGIELLNGKLNEKRLDRAGIRKLVASISRTVDAEL